MVLGIQIVGVLFGLFMLYLTFLHQKRKEFTSTEGLFWSVLWLGFIFISVLPKSLDIIVKDVLQIGRTLDFFIITGILFVVGVVFHSYSQIRKQQAKVERLVRELAFEKQKKK